MHTNSVPQEWKINEVCPIYKSSDHSDVRNYMPSSLLCILFKVLESIVYLKIIPFLRPHITHRQFGFIHSRSCLCELLMSIAEIFKSIDDKQNHRCLSWI